MAKARSLCICILHCTATLRRATNFLSMDHSDLLSTNSGPTQDALPDLECILKGWMLALPISLRMSPTTTTGAHARRGVPILQADTTETPKHSRRTFNATISAIYHNERSLVSVCMHIIEQLLYQGCIRKHLSSLTASSFNDHWRYAPPLALQKSKTCTCHRGTGQV